MPPKTKPAIERFLGKLEPGPGDCVSWTGGKFGNGYGMFFPGPQAVVKKALAHRWAYEKFVGPIPAGSVLDHLCKNILCVNPSHLEPVSQRLNVLRGESFSAKHARKTHCHQGHPLTGNNLILRTTRPGRECRECRRQRDRNRRPRKAS